MSKSLSNVFIFTVGAAIGSAVTWMLVKEKYERLAKEEIESVKDVFFKKGYNSKTDDLDKTKDIIEDMNYVNPETSKPEKGDVNLDVKKPYVVSPEECEECDYEEETVVYFSDGVLMDPITEERIKNVDELVGLDSLNHFGEFEEDTVYVRNDKLKTIFEIQRDNDAYSELYGMDSEE